MLLRQVQFAFFAVLCAVSVAPALDAQSTFVAMTPCRLVDTRNTPGPLGGPRLAADTFRSFPLLSGGCNIPSAATAYLLNITAVPAEPLGFLTAWPSGQTRPAASTLNAWSGQTTANAATIPAGTGGAVSVYVSNQCDVVIDIDGYFVSEANSQANSLTQGTAVGIGASSNGQQNTAVGYQALQVSTGSENTASGAYALSGNTSGNNNVAVGAYALGVNAAGSANTSIGTQSLYSNTIGSGNAALGFNAMFANDVGSHNVAIGAGALVNNTSGSNGTAVGSGALSANTLGSANIALGVNAGNQITTGANNIEIGNQGTSTDTGVIRIGDSQTRTFIAGISGTVVGGSAVLVSPTGQLGVAPSSRRYKEDIRDMGDTSAGLMLLRPVTFRYKQPLPDGTKPVQYELVGEEVATVYPDLVVRGAGGQVESVQYQQLPALLLNEFQKQHRRLEEQDREIRGLEGRIAALERVVQVQKTSARR